jgi:hypothetical protein
LIILAAFLIVRGAMVVFCLILECLILLLFETTGAAAHSLEEIDQLFEQEAIPTELVELTKELDMTAGAKSIREQAHAKQHQILEQYIRARAERKCIEALASISRLDLAIVELQDRGQREEEEAKRKLRDNTTAVIAKTCTSPHIAE